MGIVTAGLPTEIALQLAKLADATVFVETGTSTGVTTRWAAQHFESVFTIEKAAGLYERHNEELRRLGNVEPLLGDSREILPAVLAKLAGRKALFWLDGHWSGGDTAGADDECPLLEELKTLLSREGDVVLIDDARLFLCAPPKPHDPAQWPAIAEILTSLGAGIGKPFVQIVDDVIFAVPCNDLLKKCVIQYAQERSSLFWENFAGVFGQAAAERGIARRVLRFLRRRLGGG